MTDLTREQIERMMAMAQFAVKQKLDESQSTIEPSKMVALCQLALQAPQFQPVPPSAVVVEAVADAIQSATLSPNGAKENYRQTQKRIARAALEAVTRLGKGE